MRGQHATHVLSPAGCGLRSRVTVLNGVARGPKPGGCSFHPPAPKHCIDHNRHSERVWCPSPLVCITTACIANKETIVQFHSNDLRMPRRLDQAPAISGQPAAHALQSLCDGSRRHAVRRRNLAARSWSSVERSSGPITPASAVAASSGKQQRGSSASQIMNANWCSYQKRIFLNEENIHSNKE